MATTAPRHTIGEASRLSGVSARMIRHYEKLGLLPRPARTAADYRLYGDTALHSLRFIHRARVLGFSMDEIRALLGLWHNPRRTSAEVKRLALRHLGEIDAKIEALRSVRSTLASLAAHCHGDARPDCPILGDIGGENP